LRSARGGRLVPLEPVVLLPVPLMLLSVALEDAPVLPERLRVARDLDMPLVSVLEFDMLEPVPEPLMPLFEPIEPEEPVPEVPLPVEPAAVPFEVAPPLLVVEPVEPMLLEPVPVLPPLVPGALVPEAPGLPLVPPVLVPADPLVPAEPLPLEPVWPIARLAPSARPIAAARVNSLGALLMMSAFSASSNEMTDRAAPVLATARRP
jgi:hypothetical protein